MRILLVEDDVELARLITDGLRQAGFGVDEVSTLADADVALTVNRCDCVVADVMRGDCTLHGVTLILEEQHEYAA